MEPTDKKNTPPKLRENLMCRILGDTDENKTMILIDPEGYAAREIRLPYAFLPFLQMLDGKKTSDELLETIREQVGPEAQIEPLLNLTNYLDMLGYMDSPNFALLRKQIDEYKLSPVRPPVCAGNSYPLQPIPLDKELDDIFGSADSLEVRPGAGAIVAPHIDFQVGNESRRNYAAAYKALEGTNPDLFVIFGTAHSGNSDYFMLTKKDFLTPLGTAETDREFIEEFEKNLGYAPTYDDMAHRPEHSAEFQVLLIQKFFKNPKVKILPILCGSFFPFVLSNSSPYDEPRISGFLKALRKTIKSQGRNAVFIASGDFAHIGRKFDDDFDAEPELEKLKTEDEALIDSLEAIDAEGFFKKIAEVNDKRKICGLSPIYSMLKCVEPKSAQRLSYGQWNETQTRSAVSFASLAFYDD